MASQRTKRVLLLHNAKARQGGGALGPVRSRLEAGGLAVTVEPFDNLPEIARDIARLHESADAIVVCGGDGSISSAAPAVMDSGLPLGIIPAGTANDLARTLSIPLDFAAAADLVVAGHTRRIDVGTVNGHAFFNVASIGVSSELAQKLDPEIKTLRAARLCCRRAPHTRHRPAVQRADRRERHRHAGQDLPDRRGERSSLWRGQRRCRTRPRSMTDDWISTAWKCRIYGRRC